MEFRKMVMITLYVRQQKRHRCIEQSFGLCGRGREMIWENGIKTCVISYKKRITSPGLMQDTGCLRLVHWDDPEGWYGRVVGGGFRIGNMCTPVADSCWCMAKPIQYCKVICLQLNKFKKNLSRLTTKERRHRYSLSGKKGYLNRPQTLNR